MTVNGVLSDFNMMQIILRSMSEKTLMWVNSDEIFDIILNILHDNGFVYAKNGVRTFNVLKGSNNVTYSLTINVANSINIKVFNVMNVLSRSTKKRIKQSFNGENTLQIVTNIACEFYKNDIASATAASSAMAEYKKFRGYGEYNKLFPDSDIWKTEFRQAYSGGIVYSKNGEYHNGISYDCNSLYPYCLISNPMPIYLPEHYDGEYKIDGDMPMHADKITFRAELKKNCIPYGHVLWGDIGTDFGTDGYITRWITDVDMATLKKYYYVSIIKNIEGYKFRVARGLFTAYVEDWYDKKQHAKGAQRDIAKIMLNALIGKFGVYPRDTRMIPSWENGELSWRLHRETSDSRSYPPISMWVAAYARRMTLSAMHENVGHLIYGDTDSIVLDTKNSAIGVTIGKDIGEWKAQEWRDMRILGARRYAVRDNDNAESMNLAGVPLTTVIRYDDFRSGKHVKDDNGMPFVL